MSQIDNLIEAVRNNPKDVRYDDACKLAERMGYVSSKEKMGRKPAGTSHKAYSKPGDPEGLNFQNRKGKIPPYQARELIVALDKYGADL